MLSKFIQKLFDMKLQTITLGRFVTSDDLDSPGTSIPTLRLGKQVQLLEESWSQLLRWQMYGKDCQEVKLSPEGSNHLDQLGQ
jgi:hypothetical protein